MSLPDSFTFLPLLKNHPRKAIIGENRLLNSQRKKICMPTQEERLAIVEQAIGASQRFQRDAADHIRATDENTTILLGVIRSQGQDIKRIFARLESMDLHLDRLETRLDEHTRTLYDHTRVLNAHTTLLNEHTRILGEHTRILGEHTRILNDHTRILDEHTTRFDRIEGLLKQVLERLP